MGPILQCRGCDKIIQSDATFYAAMTTAKPAVPVCDKCFDNLPSYERVITAVVTAQGVTFCRAFAAPDPSGKFYSANTFVTRDTLFATCAKVVEERLKKLYDILQPQ